MSMTMSHVIARNWYGSHEGRNFLSVTEAGRFMFVWEARLDDGNVIRQFEDIPFERALSDPNFVLPVDLRRSTDIIPRDKVVQFTLIPTAKTKAMCPWFQQEGWVLSRLIDPVKDELLAYWRVDHHIQGRFGQMEVARQVIGTRSRETKKLDLWVLSPSGNFVKCDNDNQSFEGE